MSANVERMYSGENLRPWWVGLETGIAEIREGLLTALEAREVAGLTWEPELRAMYLSDTLHEIANYKAIVRNDTNDILGVVSDEYGIVSNAVIAQVAHNIAGQQALCTTAGALRFGGIVWYTIKLGEFKVDKDDSPIELYATLTSGHDGRHKCQVIISPVRVVCSNTLRFATQSTKWEKTIRHMSNAELRFKEAGEAARNAILYGKRFQAIASLLANTAYSQEQMSLLGKILTQTAAEKRWIAEQEKVGNAKWLPAKNENVLDAILDEMRMREVPLEFATPRAIENRDTMDMFFRFGAGITDEMQDSAWAALNAVSQFADHNLASAARDGKHAPSSDRRAESILWGASAQMKDRALDVILTQTGLTEQVSSILAA